MFGGRAQRALGVAKHGGKFGSGHGANVGANFALDAAVGTNALEYDAGIVVGRMQGERDGRTRMNADARNGNRLAQRGLLGALHRTPSSAAQQPPFSPFPGSQRRAIIWPSVERPITFAGDTPKERKVPLAA